MIFIKTNHVDMMWYCYFTKLKYLNSSKSCICSVRISRNTNVGVYIYIVSVHQCHRCRQLHIEMATYSHNDPAMLSSLSLHSKQYKQTM